MSTDRHLEIEIRFRRLLDDHALPQPDEVVHEERSCLFLWHAVELCVAVDFDDDDGGGDRPMGRLPATGPARRPDDVLADPLDVILRHAPAAEAA